MPVIGIEYWTKEEQDALPRTPRWNRKKQRRKMNEFNSNKMLSIDELYELVKSFPDPDTLVARIEVASEAILFWLKSKLPEGATGYLGIPICVNLELDENVILCRNSKGTIIKAFIRNEEKVLVMDFGSSEYSKKKWLK